MLKLLSNFLLLKYGWRLGQNYYSDIQFDMYSL